MKFPFKEYLLVVLAEEAAEVQKKKLLNVYALELIILKWKAIRAI